MPESYTRRIGLEQTGWASEAGVWTEIPLGSNIPILGAPFDTIGLMFSVQVTGTGIGSPFSLSQRGLGLDPPTWLGGGSLTVLTSGTLGWAYNLFLHVDPDMAPWSSANPPDVDVGTNVLLASGLLIPLVPHTINFSDAADEAIRQRQCGPGFWNGRIPLFFQFGPVLFTGVMINNEANGPNFANVEFQPFWNGLAGGGSGKLRAVRDGRYAMPAWNTELVRDGDEPGLFVRPFDADPEDPEATYRPRPGEGTREDEVPDL